VTTPPEDHSTIAGNLKNAIGVAIGTGASVVNTISLTLKIHPLVVLGGSLAIAIVLAAAIVGGFALSQPPKNPCQVSEATFDFESQTTQNWAIRDEGGSLLGADIRPDGARACSPGQTSLAFQINLRAAPFDKAQLKYETPGLLPPKQLSGYVYVPANAPDDLRASCFALEDNSNQAQAAKPPWPWYQSNTFDLKTGQWNFVQCAAADFVPRSTDQPLTQPLLVGFEFRRKSNGTYFGTLYLDKIVLK
jgi:hypothetical protein